MIERSLWEQSAASTDCGHYNRNGTTQTILATISPLGVGIVKSLDGSRTKLSLARTAWDRSLFGLVDLMNGMPEGCLALSVA